MLFACKDFRICLFFPGHGHRQEQRYQCNALQVMLQLTCSMRITEWVLRGHYIASAPSETGIYTALSLASRTGWADICQVSLDSALLHACFAYQGKRTHSSVMPPLPQNVKQLAQDSSTTLMHPALRKCCCPRISVDLHRQHISEAFTCACCP